MHTEGHDMGKDNLGDTKPAALSPHVDAEHPGYETTDVHVSGIAVFLAGLFGTVIIFFFFCYGMGKVITNLWEKEDGVATKWTIAADLKLSLTAARHRRRQPGHCRPARSRRPAARALQPGRRPGGHHPHPYRTCDGTDRTARPAGGECGCYDNAVVSQGQQARDQGALDDRLRAHWLR